MRRCATIFMPRAFRWKGSKGEAETGQEELNIKYGSAMDAAEYHTIAKHAAKEIGWQQGHAVSFLPKWHHDKVGSASHVHQSLWTKDGVPAFYDADGRSGHVRSGAKLHGRLAEIRR